MFEEPLELGKGTYALMPAPPGGEVLPLFFSAASRHMAWIGSDDTLRLAAIDGTSRLVATLNDPLRALGFSSDGRWLLVQDRVRKGQSGVLDAIPYRVIRYPLEEGEPVVLEEGVPAPYYSFLPDGSGVYSLRQADGAYDPASPSAGTPWLFVKPFGQPEVREVEFTRRAKGLWSPTSRHYAYFAYPNNDPLMGVDLRVYDRQTKAVETLIHVESDDDYGLSETLAWQGEERVSFAFPVESEAETSLVVTAVPLHEPTAKISVFPLAFEKGDKVRGVRLSPDGEFAAFQVVRRTTYSDGFIGAEVDRSQGVFVATIADGRVHRVAPWGSFVSWLPGSREVVVAVGYGEDKRYYRIDVQEAKEASR